MVSILFQFLLVISAASAQSYPWEKMTGPGNDPQCTGLCRTGNLVQTAECGGTRQGLMNLSAANGMFCSGRAVTQIDEAYVADQAMDIWNCFKKHPNKDKYNFFIHEMLCQWKICKNNPPRNLPADRKIGAWKESNDGKIVMYTCNLPGHSISNCPVEFRNGMNIVHIVTEVDDTMEFGSTLSSRNINLCDLGKTDDSVDSSSARSLVGQSQAAPQPAAPQPAAPQPAAPRPAAQPLRSQKRRGISQ